MPQPIRTEPTEGLIQDRRSSAPMSGVEMDACLGVARLSNRAAAELLGMSEWQVRQMITGKVAIDVEIVRWMRGLAADHAAADARNPAPVRRTKDAA